MTEVSNNKNNLVIIIALIGGKTTIFLTDNLPPLNLF